jgi:Protein of unknown function (DUF3987)
MARRLRDWLEAFLTYTEYGEAPEHMCYWSGVSAIAGALQRRVYFDQSPNFIWYPNLYIILVGPPGVVKKSSTADLGMSLLKQVPDIHFGPSVTTWQALVTEFKESTEAFIDPVKRKHVEMSSITVASSEFGNLIPANDRERREMIDMLTNLWDCKDFDKKTNKDGKVLVKNPSLNLIACTTPSWIGENFPSYMIGGGFVSRCIWVYADKKRRFIAYPRYEVEDASRYEELRNDLIHDLQQISDLCGEYVLTMEAYEWGREWYETHFVKDEANLDDSNHKGNIDRKQAQIHKLAMVIMASRGDSFEITAKVLREAERQVTHLERSTTRIFSQMGKGKEANQSDRLVEYVARHKEVTSSDAYEHVRAHFPKLETFEKVVQGLLRSRVLIATVVRGEAGFKIGNRQV